MGRVVGSATVERQSCLVEVPGSSTYSRSLCDVMPEGPLIPALPEVENLLEVRCGGWLGYCRTPQLVAGEAHHPEPVCMRREADGRV